MILIAGLSLDDNLQANVANTFSIYFSGTSNPTTTVVHKQTGRKVSSSIPLIS